MPIKLLKINHTNKIHKTPYKYIGNRLLILLNNTRTVITIKWGILNTNHLLFYIWRVLFFRLLKSHTFHLQLPPLLYKSFPQKIDTS